MMIEAAPRYLIGLPILVAVTLENRSTDTDFYGLPQLDPMSTRGPVRARWAAVEGGVVMQTRFAAPEEDVAGFTLGPGEAAQLLVDLSNMATELQPGRYHMSLALAEGQHLRRSNEVEVELVTPSAADAAEAKRLRMLGRGPVDTGAWAAFLSANWNTVTSTLSADASRSAALHLFLHYAAYGPDQPATINPALLSAISEPQLDAEVAALEHELAVARHDPNAAAMRVQMLSAHPGLAWRAEANDKGEGVIAMMRRSVGAEKQHLRPPSHMPYVP